MLITSRKIIATVYSNTSQLSSKRQIPSSEGGLVGVPSKAVSRGREKTTGYDPHPKDP